MVFNSMIKILIVEDEIEIRKIYKQYSRLCLKGIEFTFHEAGDGLEGLNLMMSNHYDYVISDISMPIMHGYGMIEEYSKCATFDSKTTILIVSGDSEVKKNPQYKNIEKYVKGVFQKPFTYKELFDFIKKDIKKI